MSFEEMKPTLTFVCGALVATIFFVFRRYHQRMELAEQLKIENEELKERADHLESILEGINNHVNQLLAGK